MSSTGPLRQVGPFSPPYRGENEPLRSPVAELGPDPKPRLRIRPDYPIFLTFAIMSVCSSFWEKR